MTARSFLRSAVHVADDLLDQFALLGFQAAVSLADRFERVAPVDMSRAEACRQALVEAEAAVEVFEPRSESDWLGNEDVSAVSADAESGPGGLSDPRPSSPPGLSLADWLAPAVCEVLAEHEAECLDVARGEFVACTLGSGNREHVVFDDWKAWRDHVSPLIAQHIVKVLPQYPEK